MQTNSNPRPNRTSIPPAPRLAQLLASRFRSTLAHDGGGWFWKGRPVTPGWVWRLVYLEVSASYSWLCTPSWLVTQAFDLLAAFLSREGQ
ncbi:hypothetical protein [Anthocerotibacter panamensis]|uniref:hypothetical protein n=1 Tax=Anthocerotibacter panamensis TaxID=2857077 RepID=UPI001C404161|nr:hypothetical protein [Anthocerotibacter panamensis]